MAPGSLLVLLLALASGVEALRVSVPSRRSALMQLGGLGVSLLQQPASAKETFQQSVLRSAGVEVKEPSGAEPSAKPAKKQAEAVIVVEEEAELSLEQVMALDIAEKEVSFLSLTPMFLPVCHTPFFLLYLTGICL